MSSWDLDFQYQHGPFALTAKAKWQAKVSGLLGPSGSGKSTFLEVILGLRERNKIAGQGVLNDLCLFSSERKSWLTPPCRPFAWVPQDGAIFPHLSVDGNLFFAFPETSNQRDDHAAFAKKVIDVLALTTLRDRSPLALSGGEKQRVVLGRALLSMRPVLLLDEPLSSLDAKLKFGVLDYIKHIRDEFNVSMIYVSHDEKELDVLCDARLVVNNGVISIS